MRVGDDGPDNDAAAVIQKSRKQKLIAEINITPFTDVILVLLVIFMITTPLIYQSQVQEIKVNLPKAKHGASPAARAGVVRIAISSEGPIYLAGRVVTLKELEAQVADMLRSNASLAVVMEIDRQAAFKNVVRVLDILNGLGIERLNIAAEEEK